MEHLEGLGAGVQLSTAHGQLITRKGDLEMVSSIESLTSKVAGFEQLADSLKIGPLRGTVVARDTGFLTTKKTPQNILVTASAPTLDKALLATDIASAAVASTENTP